MIATLNDLLAREGLASARVILMRHSPKESEQPAFRRNLIDLACQNRELFEYYQSYQTPYTAKEIGSEGYLVSALPGSGKQAILYAVYKILGPTRTVTTDELRAELPMQDLLKRGLKKLSGLEHVIVQFERSALLHDLTGRISFEWPWAPKSWCMRATQKALTTTVVVHESSLLGRDCS